LAVENLGFGKESHSKRGGLEVQVQSPWLEGSRSKSPRSVNAFSF